MFGNENGLLTETKLSGKGERPGPCWPIDGFTGSSWEFTASLLTEWFG